MASNAQYDLQHNSPESGDSEGPGPAVLGRRSTCMTISRRLPSLRAVSHLTFQGTLFVWFGNGRFMYTFSLVCTFFFQFGWSCCSLANRDVMEIFACS
jgi:hypothetical protein